MAAGGYKRYFIILDNDNLGFENDSKSLPKGYAKIEVRGERCSYDLYLQDLKYFPNGEYIYRNYLISTKDEGKVVDLGSILIDERGKGQHRKRINPYDVEGSGLSIDNFNVIAIVAEPLKGRGENREILSPLVGYIHKERVEWKPILIKNATDQKVVDKAEIKVETEADEKLKVIDIGKESIERDVEGIEIEIEGLEAEREEKGEDKEDKEIETREVADGVKEERADTEDLEYNRDSLEGEIDDKERMEKEDKDELEDEVEEKYKKIMEAIEEASKELYKEKIIEPIPMPTVEEEEEEDVECPECVDSLEGGEEKKEEFIEVPKDEGIKGTEDAPVEEAEITGKDKKEDKVTEKEEEKPVKEDIECEKEKKYKEFKEKTKLNMGKGQFYGKYDYYEKHHKMVYKYVQDMLKYSEEIQPFEKNLDNCRWWKMDYTHQNKYRGFLPFFGYVLNIYYYNPYVFYMNNCDNLIERYGHYIFGICYEDDRPKYYIYGVPGRYLYKEQPFRGMTGFVYWKPIEDKEPCRGDYGYWLLFIDARTGNVAFPFEPTIPPMF